MFTEENKNLLIEALSYIKRFNGKIVVVKYGGAAMIEEHLKQNFAQDIVLLQSLGISLLSYMEVDRKFQKQWNN